MTLSRYVLSRPARIDLKNIWQYIARDSEAMADRWIDELIARFAILGNNPRIGRERPELLPEIRSFPVGRYIIFYRLEPHQIEIVRVLHGRRDLPAIFRASSGDPE